MTNMQFKTFTWSVNPETISVTYERTMKTTEQETAPPIVTDCGFKKCRVTGQGILTVTGAAQELAALTAVFHTQGSGTLTMPGFDEMTATFVSLKVLGSDGSGISYSFEFWEA